MCNNYFEVEFWKVGEGEKRGQNGKRLACLKFPGLVIFQSSTHLTGQMVKIDYELLSVIFLHAHQ